MLSKNIIYDKNNAAYITKWIKELENSFTIKYKQEKIIKNVQENLALCYMNQELRINTSPPLQKIEE